MFTSLWYRRCTPRVLNQRLVPQEGTGITNLPLGPMQTSPAHSHKDITLAKSGIKHAGLQRRGQAWFCTTNLPSDLTVEIDQMVFHLHKFPLISRSGKLSALLAEAVRNEEKDDESENEDSVCRICLQEMPGGPDAFEQVAKFCYGAKIELSAMNVATLRCASDYLDMTEEYGERNLISVTEGFLNSVILRSWKYSVTVLERCEALLPLAEKLSIMRKCINSIATKACIDPYSSAMEPSSLRTPDGTLLWNGISTGARLKHVAAAADWWFDDIAVLSLSLFKSVIGSMEEKGMRTETVASAWMFYAKKHIPGLTRRQEASHKVTPAASPSNLVPCEADQVFLLETIESLLPSDHGVVATAFLFGLLKVATLLNASDACKSNLERRIGAQLEQATLDDILLPNYSYSSETLYDVDCVQRLMEQFLALEKVVALGDNDASLQCNNDQAQHITASPSLSCMQPLREVARLLDVYLGEIAPDMNLKPAKFRALAECLPHCARALDDGLYRAIDIFIKGHSWMSDEEKEALCSVLDCRKLSLEACTHATQNERLPMRVVVQVLFVEHIHLRNALMGCLDGAASRPSAITPDVTDAGMPAPQQNQGVFLATHHDRHDRCIVVDGENHHPDVNDVGHDLMNGGNHMEDFAQGGTRRSGVPHQYGLLSVHESRALRTDLIGLRRRINDLERECSHLRKRLRHKASTWASLSSKLTCRSMSDVSDISGALQSVALPNMRAVTQAARHSHHARISSASHPSLSYSSSTQSFYSPSIHKERQSFFLSPNLP
ncbi:hypothetical protein GOP47_0015336 [Adiantum capillus-veneris]|uniref:BTB/POZ domain-containing protein n=1 Tax=Adiantum capillus-veneris TaxID=13818 RepID=A0A9D4UJL0_ADICA|nr:hypothetical protein GOP47_0015336 [Adiantum capillus-veneris]